MVASKTIDPAKCIGLVYSWPPGNARTNCPTDQYLVLCPSFKVSTNDLYELPPGTRICNDSLSHALYYASTSGSLVDTCAKKREQRDGEKNRLEAEKEEIDRLKAANKLEEARKIEAKHNEVLLQKAREEAQLEHDKLLQKIKERLDKVKTNIASLLNVSKDGCPENNELLHWLECEILLCAAMADITKKGPPIRAKTLAEISCEVRERSRVAEVIFLPIEDPDRKYTKRALRDILRLTAQQCNPLLRMMKLSSRPKAEDFGTKQDAKSHTAADSITPGSMEASKRVSRQVNGSASKAVVSPKILQPSPA